MEKILRPSEVRKHCLKLAQTNIKEYNQDKWGTIIGHFNKALKQYTADGKDAVDDNRRLVFAFLFANEEKPFQGLSSKELTVAQKFAIGRWVGSVQDDAGKWTPRPTWVNEVYWVLSVSLWLYTITLAASIKDEKTEPTFSEVYQMYQAEEKTHDILEPEYWVNMSLSLGGIVTGVYSGELSENTVKPTVLSRNIIRSELALAGGQDAGYPEL